MNFRHVTLGCVTFGLSCALVGCSASPKTTATADASLMEADEPQHPVLYTDRDALQSGTGVMDDDAPTDFSKTSSGLKYRVLRRADGKMPTARNTVTVNYRGWLDSGREFDSSYKRGEPISFPLNGVIPGWTEGMQLIGNGGMIELWIPSKLGYGATGSPPSVPPHADLHFVVELLAVK
ncbi:MAG TPA: FKBP-type peptidyl-prolyl cis-trans isomerase [Planctomycetaceae bacterium]|nr:FKBP-type peptidyl-prolyl cis-trans isomerase [Planctomycetaceae bacterium]HQZ69318.1 FKBP-type peptidyl-prolyl cis-trans isomerase [Planctomycetaceae bacterium]HRA88648.1 FKBP-type peptidyl-prolyl cis-trans isomerase [Planctomycetaceae bacterium]